MLYFFFSSLILVRGYHGSCTCQTPTSPSVFIFPSVSVTSPNLFSFFSLSYCSSFPPCAFLPMTVNPFLHLTVYLPLPVLFTFFSLTVHLPFHISNPPSCLVHPLLSLSLISTPPQGLSTLRKRSCASHCQPLLITRHEIESCEG